MTPEKYDHNDETKMSNEKIYFSSIYILQSSMKPQIRPTKKTQTKNIRGDTNNVAR